MKKMIDLIKGLDLFIVTATICMLIFTAMMLVPNNDHDIKVSVETEHDYTGIAELYLSTLK